VIGYAPVLSQPVGGGDGKAKTDPSAARAFGAHAKNNDTTAAHAPKERRLRRRSTIAIFIRSSRLASLSVQHRAL
jgi:hypothetical protein